MIPRSRFLPDPARAAVIDRTVRTTLAESLQTVFRTCSGHLDRRPNDEHALLGALRSHAVSPAVFGLYTELVEALLAEETHAAQRLLDMLLQPALRDWSGSRVVTLEESHLGPQVPALYVRVVDDDADKPIRLAAVDAAELTRCTMLHDETSILLERAAPELFGEIAILTPEIVMAADASAAAGPGAFGGASSFYLWGAVILNSVRQQTRPQMAEVLAHEAGHGYLLGSTLGTPMVLNDPAERHASPLRADARPMEGLVHASFVLARMMWCQDRLLRSRLLAADERAETGRAWTANLERFQRSRALIESQARFTPDGAALWMDARDWVDRTIAHARTRVTVS